MYSHNNWINDNIASRISDPIMPFSISLKPYEFVPDTFQNCVKEACNLIAEKYNNLYIALSGGMDSECVVRAFHKQDISFTPIIVVCGYQIENEYAYKLCNELGLQPVIINVSEQDLIKKFEETISSKLNGVGYSATQVVFAAEYVNRHNGTLITGDHFLGDGTDMVSDEVFALSNEWDFYINPLFPNIANVSFFLHTPQLMYSMMPHENIEWNVFKAKLYSIQHREKMRPTYSDETLKALRAMNAKRSHTRVSLVFSKSRYMKFFDSCVKIV